MSSFPVCGTKEAREFGACLPADSVQPHADSIPPCEASDPNAFDICLSRENEDADVHASEESCSTPDRDEDTYEDAGVSSSSTGVSVGKGLAVAVVSVGIFATAAYAVAKKRAASIEIGNAIIPANDNAGVEAISVYDLPAMDPREQLAFDIRGMFPKMSENRARLLANGAWVRWQQVPSATREQLSTWAPIVSYREASGDAIPMSWLKLYLRSVSEKNVAMRRKFHSQMARVEAGAASRVMWVSDAERAENFKVEVRVVRDKSGDSAVFNDDVREALKGQRWFQSLPEDARTRVVSALADRALNLSRETTPSTVEVIPMGIDFIMDTASKAGVTVAFSHDGAELPSFPFLLEDAKLARFPIAGEEAPLPAFDLSEKDKALPSFKVENSRELELRRTLSMLSETEMKMEQMDDLRELPPAKRREAAKRYLVEWQELPAARKAMLVREAHARGDFCVSESFMTVPSKAWIASRFHAEREALRLADYFESVEALSNSTMQQERAIVRTWNILSDAAKREVFGGDVERLADFVNQRRGEVQRVNVSEAGAKGPGEVRRIPTAAIVRELVERHHLSRQEAFYFVTTEKPFFREVLDAWERYPAKNSFERGVAQFAAQRLVEAAAQTPAPVAGRGVRGVRKDRESLEREKVRMKGMPEIERPGGRELPRFMVEHAVK
jgi:hypothetical protein